MAAKKKLTISLSSWFCIPDQGMKDFEILCRGSAFLVKSNKLGFDKKLHVVTASHIVAPWRFPKYFPDEWVQFVNEKHTYYTADIRHTDGSMASQLELRPKMINHVTRDLAVLHFEEPETNAIELLEMFGIHQFTCGSQPLQKGDAVEFHGHEVEMKNMFGEEQAEDLRLPVPKLVDGSYYLRTNHQQFVKTSTILNYGMCGGPVTLPTAVGKRPTLCGLLEGIVPTSHETNDLRGLASVVDSSVVAEFLSDVEDGDEVLSSRGHTTLVGGEAALAVGSDGDLEKADFRKMVEKLDS